MTPQPSSPSEQPSPSGDPGHSESLPGWHQDPQSFGDQRRIGLDRNSAEGAFVDFAGRLDGRRRKHRIAAWGIIFVMFGLPVLLMMLVQFLRDSL